MMLMTGGIKPASITSFICDLVPAVIFDKVHTASYKTNNTLYKHSFSKIPCKINLTIYIDIIITYIEKIN